MSMSAEFMLDRPELRTCEHMLSGMDVLADALGAIRTGDPGSARTDVRAPWGLRFPAITGAGFHVVLRGTCWLLPAAGDPIALSPGDVVFLKDGSAHGLADQPGSPLADF